MALLPVHFKGGVHLADWRVKDIAGKFYTYRCDRCGAYGVRRQKRR